MPSPVSPASLYVHVPFRQANRVYDDAAYGPVSSQARRRYLSALRREATDHTSPRLSGMEVQSIHVGGGRPSLLSLDDLREIVDFLPTSITSASEVTMEVSPADATPDYLEGLSALGITRVSLSALSFSPRLLQAVGAPHTAEAVGRAVEAARGAGIDALAVDLLFGLENFCFDTWATTLHRAVELNVPHISIVEGPSSAPDEAVADQMERALGLLKESGYVHYSLTHFARPGHRSTHQVHYDQHGAFLGLGPSAASLWWTDASEREAERWSNVADLDSYAERLRLGESPVVHYEGLSPEALAREYILLRLRTQEGISLPVLRERYDLDLRASAGDFLNRLRTEGLAADVPDRVQLTPRGRLLTDAITRQLLDSL